MDTEKIRIFLRVIEIGTISGAAEQMGYTASGISRLVAALEEEAGFPLLKRHHSGVAPTAECETLLPVMAELVRGAENYKQLTAQLRGLDVGSITIGTAYSGYYRPLINLIADFTKKYPGIRVRIIEGTSSELSKLVAAQETDLCVISRRSGSFRWVPLGEDELVALVSKEHPAAAAGRFLPRRFSEESFIELYPGAETDNSLFFQEAGIKPNTQFSTYDVSAGITMVEAGLGITLTNSLWAKSLGGDLAALPLDPPVKIEIGLAMLPTERMSPAAKRFLSFAEKQSFSLETLWQDPDGNC